MPYLSVRLEMRRPKWNSEVSEPPKAPVLHLNEPQADCSTYTDMLKWEMKSPPLYMFRRSLIIIKEVDAFSLSGLIALLIRHR